MWQNMEKSESVSFWQNWGSWINKMFKLHYNIGCAYVLYFSVDVPFGWTQKEKYNLQFKNLADAFNPKRFRISKVKHHHNTTIIKIIIHHHGTTNAEKRD